MLREEATAAAVVELSPVSMYTAIPRDLSAEIVGRADGRMRSEIANMCAKVHGVRGGDGDADSSWRKARITTDLD